MAKIIEFDLDGTLTLDNDWDILDGAEYYLRRKPNYPMIELVKESVAKDWTVIINTARKEEHRTKTVSWLADHGVPYHYLFMSKILCTYRIDDVNITAEDFRKVLDGNETKTD